MDNKDVKKMTRLAIVAYLASLPQDEKYRDIEKAIWLAYARRERPVRFARVLLDLILAASHGETRKYSDIMEIIDAHAFTELLQVLRYIGYFCKEYDLPPYAILIRNVNGEVGDGFFRDYGAVNPALFPVLTKQYEEMCFNTVPLKAGVLFGLISAFIAKHNLG